MSAAQECVLLNVVSARTSLLVFQVVERQKDLEKRFQSAWSHTSL